MAVYVLSGKVIRKYNTNYTAYRKDLDHEGDSCRNPTSITKCGEGDCDHIDCAVYAAKQTQKQGLGLAIPAVVIGVALLWGAGAPPIIFFAIAFAAIAAAVKMNDYTSNNLRRRVTEIEEFAAKGMINGTAARQVYCVKLPRYRTYLLVAWIFGAPTAAHYLAPASEMGFVFAAYVLCVIAILGLDSFYMENGGYKSDLIKHSLDPDCK